MMEFARSFMAGVMLIGSIQVACAASSGDSLATQIDNRVRRAVGAFKRTTSQANVKEFESLAVTAKWSEIRPDGKGRETAHSVEGLIWNTAIQAALARNGAVSLRKCDKPYYIDRPIVLKPGQRLSADRETEIRLVPGANTCMVRNEHLLDGQNGPIPADVQRDARILIEGGIWTTLATSPAQSNGNEQGWPDRQSTTIHGHGVILLSNVRGAVVRNVVVRQSRAHAVQLSNCREFLVENVTFEDHRRDGIHVNGPASYGVIRNVRGVTGDDFIALNAWDWSNTVPSFGPIDHVLVENIHGNPQLGGTDEIRLLPGTKTFADGRKLDCPVADCVFRDLHDIRTFKIYDQPNLELGRDKDFCDPIGTVKNISFERLVFDRPGCFHIAANVAGLSIDDVRLHFDVSASSNKNFKLVAIGPMSQTFKFTVDNPATWVELFSPDRDVTIRGFQLTNVRVTDGCGTIPLPDAAASLVEIADQKPNPNYPKTTPRGGNGKAIVIR